MSAMTQYITNINNDSDNLYNNPCRWLKTDLTYRIDLITFPPPDPGPVFEPSWVTAIGQTLDYLDSIIGDLTFRETNNENEDILFQLRPRTGGITIYQRDLDTRIPNKFGDVVELKHATVYTRQDAWYGRSFATTNFDRHALAHEIMHAIGLGHPFPTYGDKTPIFEEDNFNNTIMSYTLPPGARPSTFAYPNKPLEFDIKCLYLLGYDVQTADTKLQRNFNGVVHNYFVDYPKGNEPEIVVRSGSADVYVFNNVLSGGTFMTANAQEKDYVIQHLFNTYTR